MTIVITPNTTTLGEDTEVNVFSTSLDMTACEPVVVDGPIDLGFWTDDSSGGGTAVQSSLGFILDSGGVAGAQAAITTITAEASLNVEVGLSLQVAEVTPGAVVVLGALQLIAPSGDVLSFELRTNGAQRNVFLRATVNSVETVDQPIAESAGGGGGCFRLLKVGAQVTGFIGVRKVVEVTWLDVDANVRLLVTNDTVRDTTARTKFVNYTRRPVVLFGEAPMLQTIATSDAQVIGSVPAVVSSGPVDLSIVGCNGATETLVDGFTFELPSDQFTDITILSDLALRS